MAEPISIQQLKDASEDAISLAEFINKPENVMIPRRLAADINSLQYYLEYMKSFAQRSYETYDEMVTNASNLSENVSVFVTNDLDTAKNGIYTYNGTSFVKGEYQPENAAKDFVEAKLGGLQVIDGKVQARDVSTAAYGLGEPRDQAEKNKESISVLDFFTRSERAAYENNKEVFDAYRPLQAFFDYIAANDVGTAYCNGTFYTSKGILFGGALGSNTKQVMGDFHICAILGSTIHTLFLMQCGKELTWLGSIHVQGLGGLIFSARTVRRGLVLGGEYQCAHTYINSVNADNGFSEFGVLIDNLTTASNIDAIRVTRCGSGRINPSVGETSSWTDKTNFSVYSENTSSGVTQETVINVTSLPLPDLKYNPILKIGGELYHVKSVDYANSRLTIFPLLNRDNIETIARYIYGAGVATAGGDASVCRIGKINSTNCSVVYHSGALYPAIVGAITAESNTMNVLLGGNTTSQAHVGGAINSLYCEAAEYDIVRRTRAQMSMTIVTNYALNLDKLYDLTRTRTPVSNVLDTASVGFDGIQIAYNGKWLTSENRAQGRNNNTSIDVTDVNRSEYWHYGTSRTFNITTPNAAINNQFGYNRKSCIVVGVNNAGNPTGDIVFNAPAGYTVNGGANVVFNGFTQAAKFDVYLQYSSNNFVVVCLSDRALQNTMTYNPPSLPPATQQSTTVALIGAKIGDSVAVSIDKPLLGTRLWAEVTESDVVTVYHRNDTADVVDVPSGNLKVKVI